MNPKETFRSLEKGDSVEVNDRATPLEVFKIMNDPHSLNGGPRAPERSVVLKGSRGGTYHLFVLKQGTKFGPEAGDLGFARTKRGGNGVATPDAVDRLEKV